LFARGIIVHSDYARNILIDSYRIKKDKVISIPIGVPVAQLDNLEEIFLGKSLEKKMNKKKIILFFGYILKRKGLDYLIGAFNRIVPRYPDYTLVLAGGVLDYQKDYVNNLKERIRKLGLENKVIFTSFLTQSQIEKFYHLCHFVVLPYTYSISSSLPLSFAIQHHKPVIATSIGSLKEEIEDGEDGILCPPKDARCLGKAMEKLIKNKKFYQKLVSGMKKKHKNRLWRKTAKQTLFFYKRII
jgi:glycosyltransferase involved in cell wall biosynthesis